MLDYNYIIFIGFRRLCFRTSFSDNPFSLYAIIIIIRVRSRTLAGYEKEFCLMLVNVFQPLALVIRNSILDLARLLELPLLNYTLGEASINVFPLISAGPPPNKCRILGYTLK